MKLGTSDRHHIATAAAIVLAAITTEELIMLRGSFVQSFRLGRPARALAGVLVAAGLAGCANAGQSQPSSSARPALLAQAGLSHTSGPFRGVKANTGTVSHRTADGKQILSVSDDFKIPDTPAPSWQVVDSNGNVYLLQQFRIKDNKTNRTITLPTYIKDVARVQVWCSFAEVLLGEASFESPVK
jgi:hypothetical protein